MRIFQRFAVSFALVAALGIGTTADAAVGRPGALMAVAMATPVAMCGYSCRGGSRYIPGPPEVCYQHGLEYCGSSRDRPPVVRREFYNPDDFRGRGRVEEYRPRPHHAPRWR